MGHIKVIMQEKKFWALLGTFDRSKGFWAGRFKPGLNRGLNRSAQNPANPDLST
jgi:hypothetical protein